MFAYLTILSCMNSSSYWLLHLLILMQWMVKVAHLYWPSVQVPLMLILGEFSTYEFSV